jgi:hypothetical protein
MSTEAPTIVSTMADVPWKHKIANDTTKANVLHMSLSHAINYGSCVTVDGRDGVRTMQKARKIDCESKALVIYIENQHGKSIHCETVSTAHSILRTAQKVVITYVSSPYL